MPTDPKDAQGRHRHIRRLRLPDPDAFAASAMIDEAAIRDAQGDWHEHAPVEFKLLLDTQTSRPRPQEADSRGTIWKAPKYIGRENPAMIRTWTMTHRETRECQSTRSKTARKWTALSR